MAKITDQITATVGETAGTVAEFNVHDLFVIAVEITVVTNNLDQFTIDVKSNPDNGAYQTLFQLAGDYTAPSGDLIYASADLTTITAGASESFKMDVSGWSDVRIRAASAAAGGSSVTVRGNGN